MYFHYLISACHYYFSSTNFALQRQDDHALSASTLPIALQRQDDHALSASTLPIALQRQVNNA